MRARTIPTLRAGPTFSRPPRRRRLRPGQLPQVWASALPARMGVPAFDGRHDLHVPPAASASPRWRGPALDELVERSVGVAGPAHSQPKVSPKRVVLGQAGEGLAELDGGGGTPPALGRVGKSWPGSLDRGRGRAAWSSYG